MGFQKRTFNSGSSSKDFTSSSQWSSIFSKEFKFLCLYNHLYLFARCRCHYRLILSITDIDRNQWIVSHCSGDWYESSREIFRNKLRYPSQTIRTVSPDPVMRSVITSLNRRKIPVFSSYMTSFYVTVYICLYTVEIRVLYTYFTVSYSPYCWVQCYGPYTEPFYSTWVTLISNGIWNMQSFIVRS